tara:strand:- start:452 stop:778 length:327 start_codon:yes stop_codon:yes gene_type:complete
MSDILMPGQGGKRIKRNATKNQLIEQRLEDLENNVGQFARAVGNDLQRFQALIMALMKDLGRVEIYNCSECEEKGIWFPVLSSLEVEPDCPSCGTVLTEDDLASDEEE